MRHGNAPMESFWGTLKNELIHRRSYKTREVAIREITECIEVLYNWQGPQARPGYLSPAVYERSLPCKAGCGMKGSFVCTIDIRGQGMFLLSKCRFKNAKDIVN